MYDDELINKAFDVIEKEFAKNFKGCTLTELKYDEEVENRFADLIEKYSIEADEELIVVLSTFETDRKGGDTEFFSANYNNGELGETVEITKEELYLGANVEIECDAN